MNRPEINSKEEFLEKLGFDPTDTDLPDWVKEFGEDEYSSVVLCLNTLMVEGVELTDCSLGDGSIYIEGSSDMEDGHYCVYGGPDWRCLGPYESDAHATYVLTGEIIDGADPEAEWYIEAVGEEE